MPPREIREFACPLLQPPINRLFLPRPIPDYIEPCDRDPSERSGSIIGPVSSFMMDALKLASKEEILVDKLSAETLKKQRVEEKKRISQRRIEADLINWNPKEYEGEEITSDPFKTIIVGCLNYSVSEKQLKRGFERFGTVTKVIIVKDKESGKPRGYAFVEFEREKDVKYAFLDADGMKIEGKRIFVDIERGRTVPDFRPRRLGGVLGATRLGGKNQNQKYPGRDPRARMDIEPSSKRQRSRSIEREREKDSRSRN